MRKVSKLVLWDFRNENTLPVTSDKIVDKKHFHPNGLYSERIFGPVKDYVCACGTYNPSGGICPICNVRYGPSSLRSTTFGHIQLPTEVVNPLFMWSLTAKGKSKTKVSLINIIEYKTFIYLNPENEDEIIEEELYKYNNYKLRKQRKEQALLNNTVLNERELTEDEKAEEAKFEIIDQDTTKKFIGSEAIRFIISYLDKHVLQDENFPVEDYVRKREWNLFKRFKDHILIDRIPVIPPDLRPMMFTGNNMSVAEVLTRLYTTLLTKVSIMNDKTKFIKDINSLTWRNYEDLQTQVNNIYNEIMDVFGGKTGIIRANILGKRIDYSGRAVIAIDPSLKYNECRVPYHMALEVYKYEFGRYLAKKENKTILVVLKDIEESLKFRDYRLIDELEEWIKDKPTLLNRQPTLHQYGMLAFNTKISSDSTIKISPTCTASYNADFDGF